MDRIWQIGGTTILGSPSICWRIQRLPRTQQRFVMQMIDTVLAQQGR
jgi:hypothetical protein